MNNKFYREFSYDGSCHTDDEDIFAFLFNFLKPLKVPGISKTKCVWKCLPIQDVLYAVCNFRHFSVTIMWFLLCLFSFHHSQSRWMLFPLCFVSISISIWRNGVMTSKHLQGKIENGRGIIRISGSAILEGWTYTYKCFNILCSFFCGIKCLCCTKDQKCSSNYQVLVGKTLSMKMLVHMFLLQTLFPNSFVFLLQLQKKKQQRNLKRESQLQYFIC